MRALRFIRKVAFCLTAMTALTACDSEDGVDGPVSMTFTDIATFEGNTAPGGGATLSVCRDGDLPAATLLCSQSVQGEEIEAGTRLLVAYRNELNEPYASGPATLLAAQKITQGKARKELEPEWNRTPVYVLALWRTGTYLNLRVRLPYSREPRVFWLQADAETLGSPRPQLYVAHRMEPENADGHDRGYYASFDIADIWNLPATEGIDVHVNNSNLKQHIFTFDKPDRP